MYRIKNTALSFSCKGFWVMLAGLLGSGQLMAQTQTIVPLTDLSFFQEPSSNWKLAANVQADLDKDEVLTSKDGTGLLINLPGKSGAKDLFTKAQYGDMDLELDYMMAKGSNSGIYLQGRYEIQLLDSWGAINPKPGDNGGIYERWDDSKPDGMKGYDGHAPRQNASRAPGLWQHMKISFQAPRFDAAGQKISNAKVIYVWLNGVLIQDNVVLSGPTRGSFDNKEAATGPLRIQGDHGAVVFRNIKIAGSNDPHPVLSKYNDPIEPILISAPANTVLRSFTDLPGGIRVTHGVGVGSPEQMHYTYDMDKGMIVQIWRGNFLDATPMWHDRGDGSSRPAGSVQYLGKPVPGIEKLSNAQAAWRPDTNGSGYKPKGYILNTNDQPVFRYMIYGSLVNDASTVIAEGHGLHREISLQNPVDGLFARLAGGAAIEDLGNGLYIIDDKSYYIRIEDAGGAKPVVRDADGKQELIIPIQKKLTYSIIF